MGNLSLLICSEEAGVPVFYISLHFQFHDRIMYCTEVSREPSKQTARNSALPHLTLPKLGQKTADKLLLAFRLLISSLLNPALSHGALQSVPRGCVVRVALKDFLSPPGLQLSPLLTDMCPRSMSIPTLCENSRNYRRNKPLGGQMPQRFIPAGSSFCPRKLKLCVRAWYHRSEKRFRKQANKEKEQFGFSRSLFLWSFFSCNVSLKCSALLLPSFFLFYLIGPPRRIIFSAFPWTTATKIAQVCCADLKTWQRALRNTRVFSICISLTQPLVALLAPQLFWSPKQAFRLHPNSSESIIFLLQRTICPLSQ